MGTKTKSLNKELARSMRVVRWRYFEGSRANETQGAVVESVARNSPAIKSGIRKGDVIRGVSGEFVNSSSSLNSLIRKHGVGAPVELVITRNGKNETRYVVLVESPVGQ